MTPSAVHRGLVSAAALGLLLASCGSKPPSPQPEASAPPFVFRSLDLRQQDLLGRPTWSLISPEARYDVRRRVAQAETPRGMIYRDGKPIYRVSATSGTVLNDGEVVLLEGRIRIEQLGPSPSLIRAERARWFPERKVMEIDRHPEALDVSNQLVGRRARFDLDSNRLSLRDTPQLRHWDQTVSRPLDRNRGQPEVVVSAREIDWYPIKGVLESRGPVLGQRRVPNRPEGRPQQLLRASSLDGNTRQQLLWLRAPVRLQDAADGTDLLASDVRLDLKGRVATTAASQGSRPAWQASGAQALSIATGCLLRRSGDTLQARQCSWNWADQLIQAAGGVVIRRQENQQFSQGELLSGRLGPGGLFTLSTPGGRVVSRFLVPRRPQPPRLVRPRPAPAPIRL